MRGIASSVNWSRHPCNGAIRFSSSCECRGIEARSRLYSGGRPMNAFDSSPPLHAIYPAISCEHAHRASVLFNKSHDLTYHTAARGRDESKASAAERLECDRIVDVRAVRSDQHQTLVEQHNLRVSSASAIQSGEPRPCRIPRYAGRLSCRRLGDCLTDGGHQLTRDVAWIGVVRICKYNYANLIIELNRRNRGVSGIATAMPDVGPVIDSRNVETQPRSRCPVFLHRAHPMHLAPRSGAHDLRSAAPAPAEVCRDKLRHVLDVRCDARGRSHTARIHKGEYLSRSVRHTASVWNGKPGNILIDARVVHAKRFENVAVNIVGPAFTTHLLDNHASHGIGEIGVLPPHLRGKPRPPVGRKTSNIIR